MSHAEIEELEPKLKNSRRSSRTKPIKPSETAKKIPDKVIEAFNELIAKNYHDGCAKVLLSDAVNLVCKKMGCPHDQPCDEHWMDVEPLFKEAGWNVEFDNPGYNETYPAVYYFTRKRR